MKRILNFSILAFLILSSVHCKKDNSAPPELSSADSVVYFTAAKESKVVNITCNLSWKVSDTSAWCTTTGDLVVGYGKITIQVAQNKSLKDRATNIFINAGQLSRQIQVIQKGATFNSDSIAPDNTGMRNITSLDLAKEMVPGWNIGNTLDAIGGETAWGNPMITQQLIDSVKAAGFKAIRIPIAWSKFSDPSNYVIQTAWMDRVEQVVNYVLNDGLYAIINIHWDGGWMVPTYAKQDSVNYRLAVMWHQIAVRFRNYNDYLLFAGTNEVMVAGDYSAPKTEYYTVQNSFNQTFVNTVRSSGGRNTYRHLIVQGYNTNIDYTNNFFVTPADPTANRLMVEVHYYDPYDFTLNTSSSITQWGQNATDPSKTETWANESYVDGQFQKMKTKFIDNGYPVIMGEYGAIARLNLGSTALNDEYAGYRLYYMQYISQSAVSHGLVPFYWDNGGTGNNGMGLFDRNTGAKAYPDIINAIVSAK
jgi:endoglucanase